MSTTPREIGTLIVVVLKANHLPNKRHIGKQDPYCVVAVNGEKRRTKAIRRGGQHPEWDEEIRFTLFEDAGDVLDRTTNGDRTPPLPPPKDEKGPKKIKGGKIMKLSCFADDPREPDLIGEADVDLTEVLTQGETDEWFTLMNKDKFCGKVYLELTFWSNAPPPEKKVTPKPVKSKQYGGPGSFVPSGDLPSSLTNGGSHPSRHVSTSSIYDHSRQNSDTTPASLRASSSMAKLDLYVPPYEQRNRVSPVDQIANEFREFGVSDHNRRSGSFPPLRGGHTPRPASPSGYSTYPSHQPHGYDQSISDSSNYTYEAPSGHSPHHRTSLSGAHYAQVPYQPQYETPPSAYQQSSIRGPRHSIPTTSSGFMPLPSPSGFVPMSSHPPESAIYGGPPVASYNTPQFNHQPMYPSQTPVPTLPDSYLPPSSSGTFLPQQSFPQSQSFQYSQYPSTSATPQPYATSGQPSSTQLGVPQPYQGYAPTPSSSHEGIGLPPIPQSTSLSTGFGAGSRPLPQQPQVVYTQPDPVPYSVPGSQQPVNSYSPTPPGNVFPNNNNYQPPPPPPPPPPPLQYTTEPPQQVYTPNGQAPAAAHPPPPPPPLHAIPKTSTRRGSSLPQPPIVYQQPQQPAYQQPVPPPPPSDFYNQPPPPPPSHLSGQSSPYHPGPPPNPPAQTDSQGQWISSPAQTGYVQQGYM